MYQRNKKVNLIQQYVLLIITMLKTIKIKEKTHKRLLNLGKKGESFDDIINRLIDKNAKK